MEQSQNIEKKEELPQPAAPAAAPEEKKAEPSKITFKHQESKGEKRYEWVVYRGLNYWFNLASSLVIADYFLHGKGKAKLENAARFFGGSNVHVERNAQAGLKQLALNSGGWLLVIPIKIMEDNKRKLVHWFNKQMGVNQQAEDGRELTPDEIYIEREQPKNSWLQVMGRRALATASTMVFGMALDNAYQKKFDPPFETVNGEPKKILGGVDRFNTNMQDAAKWAFKRIPGGESLNKREWVNRYIGMGVLDAINTEITSTVMQVTNGAKHKPDVEEKTAETKPTMSFADAALTQKSNPRAIIDAKSKDESFAARAQANQSPDNVQLGA